MDITQFSTRSLRMLSESESIARILAAALSSVDPYNAIRRSVNLTGSLLTIGQARFNLDKIRDTFVIGAGKAGYPMAKAVSSVLSDRVTRGLVIVKDGHLGDFDLAPIMIREAGHPLPDDRGIAATREVVEIVNQATAQDLVICLLSGGGSALLTSPVDGVTLLELQQLTDLLLKCGADINEINSLRKHLEIVKGGGLAELVSPAKLVTLILSDVVGDPLDVIASGPTVPDSSTYQQAWDVVLRYQLENLVPISIKRHLENGNKGVVKETPKEGAPIFNHVSNEIIGNNALAARSAVNQALEEGFSATLLTNELQGEARIAGQYLASVAREVAERGEPIAPPACIVAGGETTVIVRGKGKGGRNQELALAAVEGLAGISRAALVTIATDGGDGPTDAAGAVTTGETYQYAMNRGLNPTMFLENNDSYSFFMQLDDLLLIGPTQTNVNDLAFVFVFS